ncbi:hypothetical protein Pelo_713 [Pelomyxa schiedti]|nr:hypothetical protein Pelo_713 [Pelomyxa schiedti]
MSNGPGIRVVCREVTLVEPQRVDLRDRSEDLERAEIQRRKEAVRKLQSSIDKKRRSGENCNVLLPVGLEPPCASGNVSSFVLLQQNEPIVVQTTSVELPEKPPSVTRRNPQHHLGSHVASKQSSLLHQNKVPSKPKEATPKCTDVTPATVRHAKTHLPGQINPPVAKKEPNLNLDSDSMEQNSRKPKILTEEEKKQLKEYIEKKRQETAKRISISKHLAKPVDNRPKMFAYGQRILQHHKQLPTVSQKGKPLHSPNRPTPVPPVIDGQEESIVRHSSPLPSTRCEGPPRTERGVCPGSTTTSSSFSDSRDWTSRVPHPVSSTPLRAVAPKSALDPTSPHTINPTSPLSEFKNFGSPTDPKVPLISPHSSSDPLSTNRFQQELADLEANSKLFELQIAQLYRNRNSCQKTAENFQQDFIAGPTSKRDFQAFRTLNSPALLWENLKRESNAAIIIQRAWRRYRANKACTSTHTWQRTSFTSISSEYPAPFNQNGSSVQFSVVSLLTRLMTPQESSTPLSIQPEHSLTVKHSKASNALQQGNFFDVSSSSKFREPLSDFSEHNSFSCCSLCGATLSVGSAAQSTEISSSEPCCCLCSLSQHGSNSRAKWSTSDCSDVSTSPGRESYSSTMSSVQSASATQSCSNRPRPYDTIQIVCEETTLPPRSVDVPHNTHKRQVARRTNAPRAKKADTNIASHQVSGSNIDPSANSRPTNEQYNAGTPCNPRARGHGQHHMPIPQDPYTSPSQGLDLGVVPIRNSIHIIKSIKELPNTKDPSTDSKCDVGVPTPPVNAPVVRNSFPSDVSDCTEIANLCSEDTDSESSHSEIETATDSHQLTLSSGDQITSDESTLQPLCNRTTFRDRVRKCMFRREAVLSWENFKHCLCRMQALAKSQIAKKEFVFTWDISEAMFKVILNDTIDALVFGDEVSTSAVLTNTSPPTPAMEYSISVSDSAQTLPISDSPPSNTAQPPPLILSVDSMSSYSRDVVSESTRHCGITGDIVDVSRLLPVGEHIFEQLEAGNLETTGPPKYDKALRRLKFDLICEALEVLPAGRKSPDTWQNTCRYLSPTSQLHLMHQNDIHNNISHTISQWVSPQTTTHHPLPKMICKRALSLWDQREKSNTHQQVTKHIADSVFSSLIDDTITELSRLCT